MYGNMAAQGNEHWCQIIVSMFFCNYIASSVSISIYSLNMPWNSLVGKIFHSWLIIWWDITKLKGPGLPYFGAQLETVDWPHQMTTDHTPHSSSTGIRHLCRNNSKYRPCWLWVNNWSCRMMDNTVLCFEVK